MSNYDNIGIRVALKREEQKMSQTALAESCNVATSVISKIENGTTKKPSGILLDQISDILGVNLVWLIRGVDINEKLIDDELHIHFKEVLNRCESEEKLFLNEAMKKILFISRNTSQAQSYRSSRSNDYSTSL